MITPGRWVNVKRPITFSFDRGEVESLAFISLDGEQLYWIKFYIAPHYRPVLLYGETEIEEVR